LGIGDFNFSFQVTTYNYNLLLQPLNLQLKITITIQEYSAMTEKDPMASSSDHGLRASVFCGMLHVPTPCPTATSLPFHVPLVPLLLSKPRRSLENIKEL
jgi:hypothetical protein